MVFVNKMDRDAADFYKAADSVKTRLKGNPVPIQIPIGQEANFKGIIDLIEMTATIYAEDDGKNYEVVEIPA